MVNNLRLMDARDGITQKELDDKTGMAQSKISLYESLPDLSNQHIGTLKKIADVCGVKIDDIINPLPPLTPADEMLDFVSATYVKDKEDAENGDIEAAIRNRFS